MSTLLWIVASAAAMALVALVGIVLLAVRAETTQRWLLPFVAFAAGSLIGSALFHLIPAALERSGDDAAVWPLVFAGFAGFLALERLFRWHHPHGTEPAGRTLGYLVLIGDGLHNFIDGIVIAGAFLVDVGLGITTLIAAAAHEVPQELGDFAVLVHSGWSKRKALAFNALSALTFLLGGLLTYALRAAVDVSYLVPLAAGSFLYIGATDLVPELNRVAGQRRRGPHFAMFLAGAALMYAATLLE